jgi:Tfp pilus assembly protein PilO
MTQTRKWFLLAVLLVAVIFVAGWFLGISPQRSKASGLKSENETAMAANATLTQKLQLLKAQAQEVPAQRARLAQIRRNIPDNPALPELIRDLTAAARRSGAGVAKLEPQVPVAMVDPAAAAAVAAPAATTDSSTATTDSTDSSTATTDSADGAATTTTPAAPAAPAPPQAVLFQVPLTVTVTGDYFELEQFVNKLEGLKRSFLVTGFTIEANDLADAQDAAALAAAPQKITITGRVFMSPPASKVAQPAPVATAAPAATTP